MQLISELKRLSNQVKDIILVEGKKNHIYVISEKKDKITINKIKRKKNVVVKNILVDDILYDKELQKMLYSGISIKKGKNLNNILGLESSVIVTYSLKILNHSKKTLFGYALKGRKREEGVLRELRGSPIGRNCVLVPYKNLEQIEEFLRYWKVSYEFKKCLFVDQYEK